MDERSHGADPLAFTDAIAQVPAGGAPHVAAEALLARLSSEENSRCLTRRDFWPGMPLMMNEGYNLLAALGRREPGNPALVVDPGTYRVEACSFAGDPDALLTSVSLG